MSFEYHNCNVYIIAREGIDLYPPLLTPGGSIVKLKKIAQFRWLSGSVRSLEIAFKGVKASLTETVTLAVLSASCCLI